MQLKPFSSIFSQLDLHLAAHDRENRRQRTTRQDSALNDITNTLNSDKVQPQINVLTPPLLPQP
jgi:hypothetical protein